MLIYRQGIAIVLEGSYDRKDAENDAKKRVEQLAADVAIAINYPPDEFPQDLTESEIEDKLQQIDLSVRVVVPEDISDTLLVALHNKNILARPIDDWHELNLNSLASLIKEIAQFIISEDSVRKAEEDVGSLVQDFVDALSYHQDSDIVAKNLYSVIYRLYGFSIGDPVEIKEAIFAQATLATLLSSVYYESVRYAHQLDSLDALAKAKGPQQAVEQATHDILGINYEPIFRVIEDMLKSFPPLSIQFTKLISLATEISSKKALLRRDLAGKVYHRVVGDWALKKGLATFYTQIPAAYLLLYLAKPKLSRIADFACGSGTLMVAAYSAANANYRLELLKSGSDKSPREIENDFHTEFIKSCHAFDVLEYATQITALNLSLHSPGTALQDFSSVYTFPLGYREEDRSVSLGSLELARLTSNFDQIFGEVTKTGLKKKEKEMMIELLHLEPFDLIAMNPPFARTTGRGGRAGGGLFGFIGEEKSRQAVLENYGLLRDEIRESLEKTATKMLKGTSLKPLLIDKEFQPYRQIWQAGEGLLFLFLADMRLKKDGKLCFVLPKNLLSGISWFLVRALLAAKYHLQYVVVSYEPNANNFSESTSLSECLFIAQKVQAHNIGDGNKSDEKTTFVTLLKKPRTSIEAIALSKSIEGKTEGFVQAGESKAFLTTIERSKLLDNLDNWGRFTFLPDIEIMEEVVHLLDGKLKIGSQNIELPLVKFNELIETIGVDAHRFADTYQMVDAELPGGLKILRGGEEAQRMMMKAAPNAYAVTIRESGKKTYQQVAGNLLVPDRIRVDTAHVVALFSEERVISNIFYAVRLKDESHERLKALCLWFSTTWGILTVLASREETQGAFVRLKQSQWRMLPVLDIDKLTKRQVAKLATIFDEFKDKQLTRLPEQYGSAGKVDELRVELDKAFLNAIGIKINTDDLLLLYHEIGSSLRQWIGD
ncbi:MAG: N-6 DNA methylase [Thaumarchaeota archaeon]|nr:N-6 DNA methylase [Nitrososphaerota archaeon]